MPLVTLPVLKDFLTIPASQTQLDGSLTVYLNQCSAAIEEWCGRKFALNTYTQYFVGSNKVYLILPQRPVTRVNFVYENDFGYWGDPNLVTPSSVFVPSDLLVEGTDYALVKDQPDGSSRCGMLAKINNVWWKPIVRSPGILSPSFGDDLGSIYCSWTAGYSQIPQDIQMATCLLVSYLRSIAPNGRPLTHESYEERSVGYGGSWKYGWPEFVLALLARYRNIGFGQSAYA